MVKLKEMPVAQLEAKKNELERQIAEKMRIEYECKEAATAAAAVADQAKHEAEAAEAERIRVEDEARKQAEIAALVQSKLAHAAATGNLSPGARTAGGGGGGGGTDSPNPMLEKKRARAAKEWKEAEDDAKIEGYKAKLLAAGWEMCADEETGTP